MKDVALEFWAARVKNERLPDYDRSHALWHYITHCRTRPPAPVRGGYRTSMVWTLAQILTLLALVPYAAYHFGHDAVPKVFSQLGFHVALWIPSAACLLTALMLGVASLEVMTEKRQTILREFVTAGWGITAFVAAGITAFAYA